MPVLPIPLAHRQRLLPRSTLRSGASRMQSDARLIAQTNLGYHARRIGDSRRVLSLRQGEARGRRPTGRSPSAPTLMYALPHSLRQAGAPEPAGRVTLKIRAFRGLIEKNCGRLPFFLPRDQTAELSPPRRAADRTSSCSTEWMWRAINRLARAETSATSARDRRAASASPSRGRHGAFIPARSFS
jgi:hypothetical protein